MDTGNDSRHVGERVGSHLLGPNVVGRRIVVRRLVRGERGPSGGPAMTDHLGVCTAWEDGYCLLETDRGTVAVPVSDIVSGKPVPPRPSLRQRVPPRAAHLHSMAMWPEITTEPLGEWLLRVDHSPGDRVVARANSVLAMGDPGIPVVDAAARTHEFYTAHGRPTWAQVV